MPDYLTLGATGLARTRDDLAQLRASLRGHVSGFKVDRLDWIGCQIFAQIRSRPGRQELSSAQGRTDQSLQANGLNRSVRSTAISARNRSRPNTIQ